MTPKPKLPVTANTEGPGLPRLVLMTTGGTIGTARDYTTRLTGLELLNLVPAATAIAQVEVDDADARPSPALTPREMLALAHRAERHLSQPDVAGIVITFGTDAMDEFVYLMHLAVDSPKPVVVTGSMLHSKGPYPDGPRNLHHALLVARAPQAQNRGTMLVLNGTVHGAREVTKVSATNIASFASPKSGPLGWVEGECVNFTRRDTLLERIPVRNLEPNVDLIAASVGMDARYIEASLVAGARGIVVAAMGGGAVPDGMARRLEDLAQSSFPVVVASRCIQGSVLGRGDHARSFFPAGDLSPHKARIKLMLALGSVRHLPPDQARAQLCRYFPTDSSL